MGAIILAWNLQQYLYISWKISSLNDHFWCFSNPASIKSVKTKTMAENIG